MTDEWTAGLERQVKLAEEARAIVAEFRKAAETKTVSPWVKQLLADLDRHPDMEMVAVAWYLQDKGVMK